MSVIAVVYGTFIYLVFFRFKLLPWNRVTQFITLVFGLVFAIGFLIGLENLTPKSSQAVIVARTVDIAPLVTGIVTEVIVERNQVVKKGDVLFKIDPTIFPYQKEQCNHQNGSQLQWHVPVDRHWQTGCRIAA